MSKIYFKRNTIHHELYDYPCMGGLESYLTFSSLEGPFEKKPGKKKKERIVGVEFNKVPDFFPITLRKYDLRMPRNGMDSTFWRDVKESEIISAKEKILSILDNNYCYFNNNCFVKMEGITDLRYPYFILNILGEQETKKLITENQIISMIENVENAYPVISNDIFYRRTIRRGFSTKENLKFLYNEQNKLEESKHLIF